MREHVLFMVLLISAASALPFYDLTTNTTVDEPTIYLDNISSTTQYGVHIESTPVGYATMTMEKNKLGLTARKILSTQLSKGLAVGDFDNDGDLDIFSSFNGVYVMERNGTGQLDYAAPYKWDTTSKSAPYMQLADFDKDGYLDLFVGMDGNGFGWYPSNPADPKNFHAYKVVDPIENAYFTLADYNKDGTLDAFLMNGEVYIGNLSSSTGFNSPIQTGSSGQRVAVADLNKDGILDVVYGESYSAGGDLLVRYGTSTNPVAFGPEVVIDSPGKYVNGIDIADYNKDGNLDILISAASTDDAPIIFDGPDFVTYHKLGAAPPSVPYPVKWVDFDKDGDLDVVAGTSTGKVLYYENNNGVYSPLRVLSDTENYIGGFDVTDLDKDGLNDIVYADWNARHIEALYSINTEEYNISLDVANNGNKDMVKSRELSYGLPTSIGGGNSIMKGLVAHDMNLDYKKDLVAASRDGNVYYYEANGNGFNAPENLGGLPDFGYCDYPTTCEMRDVAVADLNHDAYPDIVAVGRNGTQDYLLEYLGNSSGFDAPTILGNNGSRSVETADINQDGFSDIITGDENGKVWYYPSSGYSPVNIANLSQPIEEIKIIDYDHDGDLDVFALALGDNVYKIENTGSGSFAAPVAIGAATYGMAFNDYNKDGLPDLFATNMNVYEGDSSEADGFKSALDITAVGTLSRITLADMNYDGLTDLIAAGNNGHIYYYEGDNSTNHFKPPVSLGYTSTSQYEPVILDYNGDGMLDIAFTSGYDVYLIKGTETAPKEFTAQISGFGDELDSYCTTVPCNVPFNISIGSKAKVILKNLDIPSQNYITPTAMRVAEKYDPWDTSEPNILSADYYETVNGTDVLGASCKITLMKSDIPQTMSYNPNTKRYEYKYTTADMSFALFENYKITCSKAGYSTQTSSGTFAIQTGYMKSPSSCGDYNFDCRDDCTLKKIAGCTTPQPVGTPCGDNDGDCVDDCSFQKIPGCDASVPQDPQCVAAAEATLGQKAPAGMATAITAQSLQQVKCEDSLYIDTMIQLKNPSALGSLINNCGMTCKTVLDNGYAVHGYVRCDRLSCILSNPSVEVVEPNIFVPIPSLESGAGPTPAAIKSYLQSELSQPVDKQELEQAQSIRQQISGILPGTGYGVKVAIIDSGVDCEHPELSGYCVDNYNAIDKSNDVTDDVGHGTMVAGIITQMAPGVEIMPIKACGTISCAGSDIVDAIDYAADHGADVISLSFGVKEKLIEEEGIPLPDASMNRAVQRAIDKGIVVVAAAGNYGGGGITCPGCVPDVITVGASNLNSEGLPYGGPDDTIPEFSSIGPSAYGGNKPDVVAPGVGVLSYSKEGGYARGTGTSFSTPVVTGIVALMLESERGSPVNAIPMLTSKSGEYKTALDLTAQDLGGAGWDADSGYGLPSISRAEGYVNSLHTDQIAVLAIASLLVFGVGYFGYRRFLK